MSAHGWPVSVDGALVSADDARVRVDDPAFAWGLAAIDTLRVEDRAPVLVVRHARRLLDTCRFLGIEAPTAARWIEMARAYAEALPPSRSERGAWAVRTTIARRPRDAADDPDHESRESSTPPGAVPSHPARVWLVAREIEVPAAAGVVLTLETGMSWAGDAFDSHKTSSRARHARARETARAQGAFDALLVHVDGDVLEASCANVFACLDGRVITPPLSRGVLPGVVRGVLLEECARRGTPVVERPLGVADLARASEVFLTNSLHGVLPVRAIAGVTRDLAGADGRATSAARASYEAGRRACEREDALDPKGA